jgi:hypothetical protein
VARAVVFDLIARTRDFERGFDRAHKKVSGFQKVTGRLGGALAGAFAGGAVLAGIKSFTDAARESQLVAAQTNAVLASTKGAAGISAKGFADLASQISKTVAVDDELIQSGENILATFTNIKGDVFKGATAAAVDMAAAMNGGEVSAEGLKSANIQLGKALNDPIKGISALTRVGVTFTQGQKDQIAAMVKAGDTAGAQKLILAELSKEFGGSAAAAATSGKKLSVAWGNAQEVLGGLLLPAIEKGQKLLVSFIGWVDRNRGAATALGAAIVAVTGFVVAMNVATKVSLAVQKAAKGAAIAWTAAQWLLNAALTANPVGLVIVAVAALVAGLILAYKKSDTFRKIVDAAFHAVATAASFMWERVLKPVFRFLVRTWLTVAGAIVHGAATAFSWVPGIGPKLKGAARKFDEFATATNRALGNIDDERVNLKVRGTFQPPKGMSMRDIVFKARGGVIDRGRGPTADDVHLMASRGEFVVNAKATARNRELLEAINAGRFAGNFAKGGVVLREDLPSPGAIGRAGQRTVHQLGAMVARNVKATAQVLQALTGGSGAGFGSGSWIRAIRELRREHVPYSIISTFRPGARTHASGSVSFHALNRAVDLDGGHDKMRIWRALTDTNPTELIYSRAPLYKSRSGWHPISRLDPVTRADHYSHVHAAYDKGGWLPTGISLATNRTGRPERVLGAREQVIDRAAARMIAEELAKALRNNPPVVAVTDVHQGLRRRSRTFGGMDLGLG